MGINKGNIQMASVSPDTEEIIRGFIDLIKKESRVIKVYLYGSYAKGVAGKWSDIDLAILSPDFSEDLFEERIKLMKSALRVDNRIEPSIGGQAFLIVVIAKRGNQ